MLFAASVPATEQGAAAEMPHARRIVSLAPSITELVYAAGAFDRLVGVVDYSDYPPEALQLPLVGDAFRVDFERIRALRPDLVLVWQSGNPVEIAARLETMGLRVVALEPTRLDDIPTSIEELGRLAGTGQAAADAAEAYRVRLSRLREQFGAARPISVFWQISADPYFTVGGTHIISDAISLCGGQNIFAGLTPVAPAVSLESIIEADPEVIIASVPTADDAWSASWRLWPRLRAVSRGALYAVHPDLISRPGPRLIAGTEAICAALAAAREVRGD